MPACSARHAGSPAPLLDRENKCDSGAAMQPESIAGLPAELTMPSSSAASQSGTAADPRKTRVLSLAGCNATGTDIRLS